MSSAVELDIDGGEPVHAEKYFVTTLHFTYSPSPAAVVLPSV